MDCPLLAPHTLPPRTLGHWRLLTFLCLPSPSKQRHNKLWRQQPVDDPAGPGDFLPETLDGTPEAQPPCLDAAAQPAFPGSGALGGPALPCCLRRLSDPLLHCPRDETGGWVHLEDVERDALLEEAAQPAEPSEPAAHPPEGPGLCEKEVRKKLEFGSPQARGGSSPQVEEMEREEALGAGKWGQPVTQLDNLLNWENLNNNNSKRSCPDDFEVGLGPRGGVGTHAISAPGAAPPTAASASSVGGFPRGSAG